MSPDILRMFERILISSGAILCIVLGYRLFHIASLKQESGGSFKSAMFSMTLTKVGPGVFFAAFGAYVLSTSLNKPVELSDDSAPASTDFLHVGASDTALHDAILALPESPDKDRLVSLLNRVEIHRRFNGLMVQPPVSLPDPMSLPAAGLHPS